MVALLWYGQPLLHWRMLWWGRHGGQGLTQVGWAWKTVEENPSFTYKCTLLSTQVWRLVVCVTVISDDSFPFSLLSTAQAIGERTHAPAPCWLTWQNFSNGVMVRVSQRSRIQVCVHVRVTVCMCVERVIYLEELVMWTWRLASPKPAGQACSLEAQGLLVLQLTSKAVYCSTPFFWGILSCLLRPSTDWMWPTFPWRIVCLT